MTIYLLILIAAFIGIVVWVFSRKRKERLVLMCRQASSAMASACASFAPNMLMNHTRFTNEARN
jgi:hypothetical protein